MNLFTFLWNEILVLIFNMVIYMQRLAIQFVEMHCTRMHISFLYILISIRVTIAFYLQTDTCLQLKKNNYSIFILYWFPIFVLYWFPTFILYWFPTFILYWFPTFVLYWFPTKNLDRSWTILIGIGQTGRNFFSTEDYTNMNYYNCCGIRPKNSNISKRVGEGVITICVVLDQSTVIFQRGGGVLQFVWYWDQNSGNVMFYQLVVNLQSVPVLGGFQSPLLTNKAT